MDFENLKQYLKSKNLHVGSHCTDKQVWESIKQNGINHSGDILSTVKFHGYAQNLDNLKTVKHKDSNCVVVVGIPNPYFEEIYKKERQNWGASNEFCELANGEDLPMPFVLNPKYVIGVYDQQTEDFELNEKAITEYPDYEEYVEETKEDVANRKFTLEEQSNISNKLSKQQMQNEENPRMWQYDNLIMFDNNAHSLEMDNLSKKDQKAMAETDLGDIKIVE